MSPGRKLLALLSLLFAVLLGLSPASAQSPKRNHIFAELLLGESAGQQQTYAFHFVPEPGWHGYWINSGDAGYGLEANWSLPAEWIGTAEYPVPQTLLISGLMNHVYEHEYAVLVPVTLPAGASVPGTVTVDAQWLACTDKICVPERATLTARSTIPAGARRDPRLDGWRSAIPPLIDSEASFAFTPGKLRISIPLPASLEITAPHVFLENTGLVDYAAPQEFWRDGDRLIVEIARAKAGADNAAALSGILKLDDQGNGVSFAGKPGEVSMAGTPLDWNGSGETPDLLPLIGLALLGGLLLNIMPCVFPILSLKALSLARAGESEAEARREGLAYTAGVVLACLALGGLMLALRAAGNEIGWAFQLQEPGVVVALLVLAVAITANFAGLFELPSLSFTSSGKPLGAFATGLLAAFVATPCTGPFMAAAMGAALLLPPAEALLLFAALGLGIALPFLALGFVPPLRRLLPKPGNWMNTFRKVMAVPMGLTALALLWLCWQVGGQWFALASAVLAASVVLALSTKRWRGRGWSFAIVAVMVLTQLSEPPAAAADEGIIAAQPFSEAALAEARALGKPVFVWFTADWCLTCKVNEGVAIEREETKEAFEKAGVIALKGDWTRRDPEITRFLTAQGAAGIPLYLWYKPGAEAEQLPQVLTPSSLVDLAQAK